MLTFEYKAMKNDGEITTGEIKAPDHSTAVEMLQNLGHIPIQVNEASRINNSDKKTSGFIFKSRRSKFSIIEFTRDLATLLSSEVSLESSMVMLVDLAETEQEHALLNRILDRIRNGQSLSSSLSEESSYFNHFYINMIKAGEESGALDVILVKLSEFLDQYHSLKSNVLTSLIYPVILLAVTLVSFMILLTVVVPQFQVLFEDMGQELPVMTQFVISVGEVVSSGWWIFLFIVIAIAALIRKRLSEPAFRLKWDRIMLRLPVFGELLLRIEIAVFSRTLSTLLGSGVTLLESLTIVKQTMMNQSMAQKLTDVIEQVREGGYLADSLARAGGFPRLFEHLVRVGEESSKLESTLVQLAEIYDREVKISIQRLLALVEPVLIIGLGLLIGGVIASILMAILSVNELAF